MRKAIILGSILALIGVASVAQASDILNSGERDTNRVHSETSNDSQTDRLDRTARNERHEGRHDERRDRSRAHLDESRERSDRR